MIFTRYAKVFQTAVRQGNFEQAVAFALHLWPALTLSVQNNWGGPDSSDKRDWFAGAVVDLFPEFTDDSKTPQSAKPPMAEPDLEDVETVLLQVMVDEFEVNVDDDSGFEAAETIMRARSQCAQGQWEEVEKLRERFQNRKGKKVEGLFKKMEDQDQDTDWESDGSGSDDDSGDGGAGVDMGDAPALVTAPKEKAPPEIDEDGFTKVTKKR